MLVTTWSETVPPDEEARFAVHAERMAALKRSYDTRYGERARALHRLGHAGARVIFEAAAALPAELQVGPFGAGAVHQGYVRFSNGSWERAKKDVPEVRGVAVKLVGVPGTKILTGTEAPGTQDLLFIQGETTAVTGPDEFVALAANLGQGQLVGIFKMMGELGIGRAVTILRETLGALGKPFPSFASARYSTATPFRLGPTAAKFSLVPLTTLEPRPGGLAKDLAAHLQAGFAWELRATLYQDEQRTPIEDPRVAWDGPEVVIGTLRVTPVDLESAEGKAVSTWVERLAFDPWHSVDELRPLGAMNRLRRATYFAISAKERDTVPEPDGSETFA